MPEDKFETKSGVRQGGPESVVLYNLFMDYVMRLFTEQCSKKKIHFLKLKYQIPSPASKHERDLVGTYDLDWVGMPMTLGCVLKVKYCFKKLLMN